MKDVVQVNYIIVKNQIPTLNPGFWFWNWAVMEEKWILFKRNFFIFLLILDKTFKNHVKICGQNQNWKKNLVEITCQQKQNQFSSRFQVYPKHYFLGIRSVTINTYIQASWNVIKSKDDDFHVLPRSCSIAQWEARLWGYLSKKAKIYGFFNISFFFYIERATEQRKKFKILQW